MKWFDRTFTFDLAGWMLPNVLERLRGTPARLEELIGNVPARLLAARSGETWSIQENVGHLLDLEPLWAGRVEDLRAGAPQLRPADLSNRRTHEADHNAKDIHGLLAGFRTARERWVHELDAAPPDISERTAEHPRLKQPMRLIDLLFFVAEHDDHHLARISALKRLAGVNV